MLFDKTVVLWFKGEIRKRSLGFNEKYKEKMSKIWR